MEWNSDTSNEALNNQPIVMDETPASCAQAVAIVPSGPGKSMKPASEPYEHCVGTIGRRNDLIAFAQIEIPGVVASLDPET